VENNQAKQMLSKLQMLDFSIYETVLYLDAYPHDSEALAYYHKLLDERKVLLAEYERTVGPVTICGNVSEDRWDWIGRPWPWEYDAN